MSDIEDLCQIIHRGIGLNFEDLADEIIAAGFHRNRTIDTEEELEELADETVIRNQFGDVFQTFPDAGGMLFWLGDETFLKSSVRLPAIVLWEPSDD